MGDPPQPWHGLPTLPQGGASAGRRARPKTTGTRRRSSLPFADIKTVMSGRSAAQPCRVPPSQGGTHGPRSPAGRRQCAFMIMPSGIRGAWCERRDSNPHGGYPLEPKSSASTNSATFAGPGDCTAPRPALGHHDPGTRRSAPGRLSSDRKEKRPAGPGVFGIGGPSRIRAAPPYIQATMTRERAAAREDA